MRFLLRSKLPEKPKIDFGHRCESIYYRWKERSILLNISRGFGSRAVISTNDIKRWNGPVGMTREEKQKVFTDVLEFVSRRRGKAIIVEIDRMDPDRPLWESLCALYKDVVCLVEYTSDEVACRMRRETVLEALKKHGRLAIEGMEISSEEQLDEVLGKIPLREELPANVSPVDQLRNPSPAYSPMSERAFIQYALGYTTEWVIETFRSIPDEALCRRVAPALNQPAWIFGHIAVTERLHVGCFLEGVNDIPAGYRPFRDRCTDGELRKAFDSKDELIGYWRDVRTKTERYIQSITDEELCRAPENELIDGAGPNRDNPRREWFVMTIQHQHYHWGQLAVIGALLRQDAKS